MHDQWQSVRTTARRIDGAAEIRQSLRLPSLRLPKLRMSSLRMSSLGLPTLATPAQFCFVGDQDGVVEDEWRALHATLRTMRDANRAEARRALWMAAAWAGAALATLLLTLG